MHAEGVLVEDYDRSALLASKNLTETFSTSFSSASKLFDKDIRQDIYNIYGLVRVADEIVDTYQMPDAGELLEDLENEVYAALGRGFSVNIIVHAFVKTAKKFTIKKDLISPFFESMQMDLTKKSYNKRDYEEYIYGSAEVVGLMCLKVFTAGDSVKYSSLKNGASALGSAFQKVNFLRDIKDDYEARGRYYFPLGSFESFDDSIKSQIVRDIKADFKLAKHSIDKLPASSKLATRLAYEYYIQLLSLLEGLPSEDIKRRRIRVGKMTKLKLLVKSKLSIYV